MIDVVFKFDDTLQAYVDQLAKTPKAVNALLQGSIKSYLNERIHYELGYAPGRIKYPLGGQPPLDWQTKKQRRAYFASNGFGGGIPSTRTGSIINSWESVIDLTTKSAGLINTSPVAQYVIGERMQRFHQKTGWRREDEIALRILNQPDFEDILIQGWVDIVEFKGTLT